MQTLNHLSVDSHLSDDTLSRPLALAHYLLAGAESLARQFSELGAIDLPPVVRPAADQNHIQIAAPLYLAAELEAAQLLPAAETLAALFASGALRIEGEAADQLYRFWQGRSERFSRQERQAFFARLFGRPSETRLAVSGSRNRDFETQLAALAEAIVATQPDAVFGRRPVSEAGLTIAASRLINNLVGRSGGIATFAARDILKAIEQAISILKLHPVQAAVGAISVWTAVQAVARSYLEESVNVTAHVQRGKSGMLILTWVAEILPHLDSVAPGGHVLPPNDPIFSAAVAWLQATLELQETGPVGDSTQGLTFPTSGAMAPRR
ncbi:MAG: hypothetical protein KDJ52_02395 [Anaerolineae bacterium]|nr:hypothetical protein [Anaerolineae bacterium]